VALIKQAQNFTRR